MTEEYKVKIEFRILLKEGEEITEGMKDIIATINKRAVYIDVHLRQQICSVIESRANIHNMLKKKGVEG